MEFYRLSGNRLGLREIPPLLAGLMRQIPGPFGEDTKAVEDRLFPTPSDDESEKALREDWKAHVEPELHALFLSARQVVEADLRGFREEEGGFRAGFPRRSCGILAECSQSSAPFSRGATPSEGCGAFPP